MAVANFFDRALMSAGQALNGMDPRVIIERLGDHVIELAFDATAVTRPEGLAALDLAVRLLARLYPAVRITSFESAGDAVAGELAALALSINPLIDLSPRVASTVRLVFGDTAPPGEPVTIYAGSDGWLAKVSTRAPRGAGSTAIAFGAGAAACLGAANVFRAVFRDALPAPDLDDDAVLSLFDFTTGDEATPGPDAVDVDLGSPPLAGMGAIGNGLIWALARTPGLKGSPHLIDHEQVELSNLQRYVLATQADIGRVKVEIARAALDEGGLGSVPFLCRLDEYLQGQGHPTVALAVAALDTAADRIGLQAALPARILNAWTQPGDLGLSRHGFLGEEACLACLYLPRGAAPNEDQLIARALGFPEAQEVLLELRERLVNGHPVGEEFVRAAALRLDVPVEALIPFAGEPLRQFYAKAVCGGQLMQATGGRPPFEAPLPFQSALAGVMLAAELVAETGGLRKEAVRTKTTIDVTRRLGRRLNVTVLKTQAGAPVTCICQDSDFKIAFAARHGADKPILGVGPSRAPGAGSDREVGGGRRRRLPARPGR